MASFSGRQSFVATSSGIAEDSAMCSTAEELLHMRSVAGHVDFKVNTTPRGIAQRAGLVKVLAVETLGLQELVRDCGSQIRSVSSRENWGRKFHAWPG